MKKSILLAALLALPLSAAAEGLSYNYVQLDWIGDSELDGGGSSADGDGFDLSGVFSIADTVYILGSYQDLSYDGGGDLEEISLGVGIHSSQFTGAIDVFGNLTYENIDGAGIGDDNGFGLEIGARTALADAIDGYISYDFSSVGDIDGSFFKIGAAWAFNPNWAVTGEYLTGDYDGKGNAGADRDDLSIGLRYNF